MGFWGRTKMNGESVSHAYRRGGTFPLVLSVTDDEGRKVTLTNTVSVQETSVETLLFREGQAGYSGTFERRVQANGFSQLGREVASITWTDAPNRGAGDQRHL